MKNRKGVFYKTWWFWLIIILVILVLIIMIGFLIKPSADSIKSCQNTINLNFPNPNPVVLDYKNCYMSCCEDSYFVKKSCDSKCLHIK